MSDTPIPAACDGIQQNIDDVDTQIETLRDALLSGEIPEPRTPANIAGVERQIRSLIAARLALEKQLASCIHNQSSYALRVNGIEVTQSIQNALNQVPLIAGKATVVRVYVSWLVAGTVTIKGNLSFGGATLISANQLTLQGSDTVPPLSSQRNDVTQSLNFVVPAALTVANPYGTTVQFVAAIDVATETASSPGNPQDCLFSATFHDAPTLKVHMLGIRYSQVPNGAPAGTATQTFTPSDFEFRIITSWLRRAYPTAAVISSTVIVDSNIAPPFDCNAVNTQIAAVRAQDMAIPGTDLLTHYFGLVSDGNGAGMWMRGCSVIPSGPDPSAVGSGPTGNGSWGWDFDGCYGDWYTGHELGHTFGRLHPGSGCGDSADDHNYPFPAGQLAAADDDYVGFDVGDADLNLPMVAYPGTTWHDVMSYCSNIWLSSYTYDGIRDQLYRENNPTPSSRRDAATAGPPDRRNGPAVVPAIAAPAGAASFIHLVGTVNLTKGTGRIDYLTSLPAGRDDADVPSGRVTIRFTDTAGTVLADYPIATRTQSCQPRGADTQAMLDVVLVKPLGATRLILAVDGKDADDRKADSHRAELHDLHVQVEPAGSTLRWHHGEAHHPAGSTTFIVQASGDGGKRWFTLAVGLPHKEFQYHQTLAETGAPVRLRVVATDGFSSSAPLESTITQH